MESKYIAIRMIQEFSRIGHLLSGTCELLHEKCSSEHELASAIKPIGKLMGDIQFEILYPIIKAYPELRPEYLLDDRHTNVKYKICRWDNDEEIVVEHGISAEKVRYQFDQLIDGNPDSQVMYWMEIENIPNQQVDPTVKTPVESGKVQGTAGHP